MQKEIPSPGPGEILIKQTHMSLDPAMIGWMSAAALYSMAGLHWFYTILALNLLLHTIVRIGGPGAPAPAEHGARARRIRRSPPPRAVAGAAGALSARVRQT